MISRGPQTLNPNKVTLFDSTSVPPISILDFVNRLMMLSNSHPVHLLTTIILLDKLIRANQNTFAKVVMSKFSVHRIVATSLMISTKFLEDQYFDNKYWARLMGVDLKEANRLERSFLKYLDYKVNITLENFI